MQVVRQVIVDALAILWRDKRRSDEVYVAEEKEQGGGDGGTERWVPLVVRGIPVDPEEAAGDEDVDDRERVCDDVEDEVVCISRRRGEHDDHRNDPVFEETSQRGVERLVAGPEAREW